MGSRAPSTDASLATTVLIPVKNGGKMLERCLTAVNAQKTSFPFEVLCIDSGSTDTSLETIQRLGARLYEIAPADFGHGKTRNLGVELSQTPFVAVITQDAIPASERWLEELISPFQYDDTLAGVFGMHLPHEDCRPAEAYMLERHFSQFGPENVTVRIGQHPRTWTEYAAHRDAYCFFSDNNAALRKSVWELIPYPDVEFMEDQLWAASVLEAGYGKAWAPRAAVRHSHNYDAVTTLRRSFDENRFRRLYQDPPRTMGVPQWIEHARVMSRRDSARLSTEGTRQWLRHAPGTALRHGADALGRFLGDNSPFLPHSLVRRVSQHVSLRGVEEKRLGNSIVEDAAHYLKGTYAERGSIDGTAELAHQLVHVARSARSTNPAEALLAWRRTLRKTPSVEGWWNAGVYRFLQQPAGPLLEDRKMIQSEELTLNWVVPPFGEGGGGHLNIFRMIHLLERRGIHSRVYVQDGEAAMPYPSARLRDLVHEWFAPIEAPVDALRDSMLPADFAIATHWSTAYSVRALGGARHLAYFVQDYEPLFYATGSESVLAEATYGLGFYGITAGEWLKQLMTSKFGMTAASFPLAVDHEVYWPEPPHHPGPQSIFAYIRPHTPRRAFELVALALQQVKKARPSVQIHTAGAVLSAGQLPFPFIGHGILRGEQLRKLYSSVTLGISPSLTNYSLLPQEMAACGCPVIDLKGENTAAVYPKDAVVLAEPTVDGLAQATLKLLDNDVYRRQQVRRSLDYASTLTWDVAADSVEAALREWGASSKSAQKPQRRAKKLPGSSSRKR